MIPSGRRRRRWSCLRSWVLSRGPAAAAATAAPVLVDEHPSATGRKTTSAFGSASGTGIAKRTPGARWLSTVAEALTGAKAPSPMGRTSEPTRSPWCRRGVGAERCGDGESDHPGRRCPTRSPPPGPDPRPRSWLPPRMSSGSRFVVTERTAMRPVWTTRQRLLGSLNGRSAEEFGDGFTPRRGCTTDPLIEVRITPQASHAPGVFRSGSNVIEEARLEPHRTDARLEAM